MGALVSEARKEAQGDKQGGKEPSPLQSFGELSSSSHGTMSTKYLQGALARLADSVGQDGGKIRTANTTEEARKALEGPAGVIAKASTASSPSYSSPAGNDRADPVGRWALGELEKAYRAVGKNIDTTKLLAGPSGRVEGAQHLEPLAEMIQRRIQSQKAPEKQSDKSANQKPEAKQKLRGVFGKDEGTASASDLVVFRGSLLINGNPKCDLVEERSGVFSGVIRYFYVDVNEANALFSDAAQPAGSPGSNLVVEVSLKPREKEESYVARSGDTIGLRLWAHFKRRGDQNQESQLLEASRVLAGEDVVSAVSPNEGIKSFSVWPELTSAWRWRLTSRGGWCLASVRWRFLMKKARFHSSIPSLFLLSDCFDTAFLSPFFSSSAGRWFPSWQMLFSIFQLLQIRRHELIRYLGKKEEEKGLLYVNAMRMHRISHRRVYLAVRLALSSS